MTYNVVTKEPTSFPALGQTPGGHKFKDGREVTGWQITQDMYVLQWGMQRLFPRYHRYPDCGKNYLAKKTQAINVNLVSDQPRVKSLEYYWMP
jgi:hypothetical protein